MRIAMFLASPPGDGGMEKHVLDLSRALAKRGHQVFLLADPHYRSQVAEPVSFVPVDVRAWRYSPIQAWRLWLLLRRLRPDVIHGHGDKAARVLDLWRFHRMCRTVVTLHNLKRRRGSLRSVDGIIAVSAAVAGQVGHRLVTIVHNGIERPVRPDSPGNDIRSIAGISGDRFALAIGRLVPAKGFDLLIEAWPRDEPTRLLIAGDGPEYERLSALRNELQKDNVLLLGHQTDVQSWLSQAEFLVISSRKEGGPYVLAEALIQGLPVVGTRVGFVPEYLPQEWTVPPGDFCKLSALLKQALEAGKEGLIAEQRDAIARARERLTLDAMCERTEAVYRSDIALRQAVSPER